jgi:two-component system, LytTR family, response regulator
MATSLRALLVDDEPIARQILREELADIADVEVVEEAANGHTALAAIAAHKPDLVLLDLHMPGMGGFEVVEHLSEYVPDGAPLPSIVIVTAFDQHAIKAFEAGAVDYLLKPVSADRLRHSIDRVRKLRPRPALVAEQLVRLQDAAPATPATASRRKIVGRLGDTHYLLDSTHVLAFQADGELVWIITATRRYLAAQTLKAIEVRLEGLPFSRIHRSTLVNLEHVAKMSRLSSNRWVLTLKNGLEFTVSKRQAHAVEQLLAW